MPETITVLHLSDMQFGANHCFGKLKSTDKPLADINCDTLLKRLCEDLNILRKEHDLKPDVIAVTGDLTEWGLSEEFEQAEAFLSGLADYLNILPEQRHRIAIIPGNHDIDRDGAAQDFLLWRRRGKPADLDPFGFTRWENFANMFHRFYKGVPEAHRPAFVDDRPYTLFQVPEYRLIFAGLNSTIAECHDLDERARKDLDNRATPDGQPTVFYGHHGYCGQAQLDWFKTELSKWQERGWLRVGLVHHNLYPAFDGDEENLSFEDRMMLHDRLESHLNLLLHGHTHRGNHGSLRDGVPVFVTGTPSLNAKQKQPDIPNQYQLLRLQSDGVRVFFRSYLGPAKRFDLDNERADKTTPGQKWRKYDFLGASLNRMGKR